MQQSSNLKENSYFQAVELFSSVVHFIKVVLHNANNFINLKLRFRYHKHERLPGKHSSSIYQLIRLLNLAGRMGCCLRPGARARYTW